ADRASRRGAKDPAAPTTQLGATGPGLRTPAAADDGSCAYTARPSPWDRPRHRSRAARARRTGRPRARRSIGRERPARRRVHARERLPPDAAAPAEAARSPPPPEAWRASLRPPGPPPPPARAKGFRPGPTRGSHP